MDITWIATSVLGLTILYLIYSWYNKKSYWEQRGVPELKQSLFKTLKLMFLSSKTMLESSMDMYEEHSIKNNEQFFGYSMANTRILSVTDPELIQHILIKDFSYFEDRSLPLDSAGELVNLGLASLTGEKWRLVRHKMMPSFSSGKMKMMFSQIKECSDEFVLYLKGKPGQDLETTDFLFKFMINVIASTAFSMKADAFNDDDSNQNEFVKNSRSFLRPSRILQVKTIIFAMFPKLKNLLNMRLFNDSVDSFFLDLTVNLIKQRTESGKKRNDFLQLMLDEREKELGIINNTESSRDNSTEPEEGEHFQYLKGLNYDKDAVVFTDKCIAAQTFLFISGGSETTASILSYTLHELAVNQDIQKKVQAEIDSVLSGNEFNYDALKKMMYMEQVLNEVLRLRTPGVVASRMCVQNYKLPGTDVVLEKGCMIQIPVFAIHRDPRYFADPETFNPDRFEDIDSIPKGVYWPFGGGPRMCIAMRLAMLEMKVFLATVLSSYNVLHSDKTPLPLVMDPTSFLQVVKGGLWVKFEARQQKKF